MPQIYTRSGTQTTPTTATADFEAAVGLADALAQRLRRASRKVGNRRHAATLTTWALALDCLSEPLQTLARVSADQEVVL
jgi:hypothetical protein